MEQSNEELEVVKVDDEVNVNEENRVGAAMDETKTSINAPIMKKVRFLRGRTARQAASWNSLGADSQNTIFEVLHHMHLEVEDHFKSPERGSRDRRSPDLGTP